MSFDFIHCDTGSIDVVEMVEWTHGEVKSIRCRAQRFIRSIIRRPPVGTDLRAAQLALCMPIYSNAPYRKSNRARRARPTAPSLLCTPIHPALPAVHSSAIEHALPFILAGPT